tara:strand:+ start:18311 stop:19159 length:849 start_codon:yes stop_codon:yes gene_type:complete
MENYLLKHDIISNDIQHFHKGTRDISNINVMKCNKTGLIFLDKHVKFDYNKGVDYWDKTSIEKCREKTFDDDNRRSLICKKYIYENCNLLDFGCGHGGLLSLLPNNINKFAIDLNSTLFPLLKKEKIIPFTNINNIDKKMDFITMFHVLEHLSDPIQILKNIKNKMSENGVLIIEVPYAKDILFNLYDNNEFKNFTFWSQHLILYTKNTLEKILKISGFKNIHIENTQRYNLFNHLYWLSKSKPGGHKKWGSYEEDKNLIKAYNDFLIRNDTTDTIIAYCTH